MVKRKSRTKKETWRYKISEKESKTEKKKAEKQNKIRNKISEHEKHEIEEKLKNLENIKNDANKYYQALREMKRTKPKENLCVHDDNGNIVGTTNEQAEKIADHFERFLAPKDKEIEKLNYPPVPMSTPFTSNETKKAAKSLKNNKSCGIDEMYAEHVKYAPTCVHSEIAEIFNETAETGKNPSELK